MNKQVVAVTHNDALEKPRQDSLKGRIACFIPGLSGGGAERVMIHLAEGFVSKGWTVDLVVGQVAGAYVGHLPKSLNLVDLRAKTPQVVTKTLALVEYLRQQQPKVLLTTLDLVNAAAWARRLANVSTQVIMIVQTHLTQQFRDRCSPWVQRVRSHIIKQFYPWADHLIAASEGVAKDLAAMMGIDQSQIRVIYNPVVRADLAQQALEKVEHPWFTEKQSEKQSEKHTPVLLGMGRLVKQKDFPTLILAFAKVRAQRPCRLVIIGDTDMREAGVKPALEQLIAHLHIDSDVTFLGFVDNPYKYMARAQVFVLSSIYEGFGNVVAEALAVGTSVVSTNCESGPAEILADEKFGRLVAVGDSSALAIAIMEALDNPHPPAMLEARSRDFTVESIVDQYCEVIGL
jgi:glycosyltransferase involved in cell wall biosynthesis